MPKVCLAKWKRSGQNVFCRTDLFWRIALFVSSNDWFQLSMHLQFTMYNFFSCPQERFPALPQSIRCGQISWWLGHAFWSCSSTWFGKFMRFRLPPHTLRPIAFFLCCRPAIQPGWHPGRTGLLFNHRPTSFPSPSWLKTPKQRGPDSWLVLC